jgi:hypothetical protein
MLLQILYREEDEEDINIIINRVKDLIGDIVQFEMYLYKGVMVKTDGEKQREIHTLDKYQWDKDRLLSSEKELQAQLAISDLWYKLIVSHLIREKTLEGIQSTPYPMGYTTYIDVFRGKLPLRRGYNDVFSFGMGILNFLPLVGIDYEARFINAEVVPPADFMKELWIDFKNHESVAMKIYDVTMESLFEYQEKVERYIKYLTARGIEVSDLELEIGKKFGLSETEVKILINEIKRE